MERIRLFIADDENIIRQSIEHYIDWQSMGVEVVGTGANGREVLQFLERNPVDILISDIRMPEMDGIELLRQLSERQAAMRVIFITAHSDFEYARQALRYRIVDDYLLKPINKELLAAAVRKSIEEIRKIRSHVELKELTPLELEFYSDEQAIRCKGDILNAVKQANRDAAAAHLRELVRRMREQGLSLNFFKRYSMDLYNSINDMLISMKHNINNITSANDSLYGIVTAADFDRLTEYMIYLCGNVCTYIDQCRNNKMSYLICSALELTEQNYRDKDFNLLVLANMLSVSPNYLSAKFKEETGIGFIKLLNNMRIDKAKELLADPRLKIYEIASRSGIDDVRYMARLFREYTGQTPKEYRSFVLHGKVADKRFDTQ